MRLPRDKDREEVVSEEEREVLYGQGRRLHVRLEECKVKLEIKVSTKSIMSC